MNNMPRVFDILVKVGYIVKVMTNRRATEAMLKEPVAEPLQKLP
jgi:hypothetical protein